jgi:ribosomal-protein-alanine N-acetyltransferase
MFVHRIHDDTARALKHPTKEIRLVDLSAPVLHALAAGNLGAANRLAPVALTPYLVEPGQIGVWQRRSRQIVDDPTSAGWITRAIYDPKRLVTVGQAGYHGPPDHAGMVEVGYSVDPVYRRQGYARAALVAMLDRAYREPGVRTVRASVTPSNVASRHLVAQFGFVEVGEQWDDVDGLETIFEVSADRGPQPGKRRSAST